MIYNNSAKTLLVSGGVQTDTLLSADLPHFDYVTDVRSIVLFQRGDWIDEMSDTDTVRVFIYDRKEVEDYGWLKMRDEYNVLARYDLSKEDLISRDRTISYPPDEAMNGVRMLLRP